MTGSRWLPAILSTLFVAASISWAQQEILVPAPAPAPDVDQPSTREVLQYAVEWRLIPAGTAKFIWTAAPHSLISPNEIKLHLESSGLVSRLFRVDDDYSALLGQSLCAQSTFIAAREGNRNRETRVVYDERGHKAERVEKDLNKNTSTMDEVEIPPCVHDVLGGLMVLRNLRLEPGKTAQIPVSDGKKFAQVKVESERREDLNTPMGLRKTIRYEVFLFDNVIYKRTGHLHVWLTDDSSRLPVQFQVRLQFAIGTITLRLEKQGNG
jgi:hypothetical protein